MIDLNAHQSISDDDSALDDVDLEGVAPKAPPKELPSVAIVPLVDPLLVDINKVALVPPKFLIADAIETPCTGMVFGASGSGKSFFVLDIALHVACGRAWLKKAVKAGPVIYLCGEGRHAIPRRVAAWKTLYGEIPDGRFLMSQRRVEFDPNTVLEMVCEINALAEKGAPPVLIIIDTLARSLPADADENSSRDIMNFLETCDRIQRRYDCVVLIVHHTGHNETKRARGSSAIKGAMDLEILLDKSRGVIEWTKTKDAEPHLPIKYELVKTAYGTGIYDNSCVVRYDTSHSDPQIASAGKHIQVATSTLSKLCHDLGTVHITEDTWREEFYNVFNNPSQNKKYFSRAKTKLIDIDYISVSKGVVTVKSGNIQGDVIEQEMFGKLLAKKEAPPEE